MPVPALLYGDPRPGRWCAVQVGARLRLPRGPVESLDDVPVDVVTGEHMPVSDEPAVDPAALPAVDRQAAPGEVRAHRTHPMIAWAWTLAAVPVLLATVGRFVASLLAPLDTAEAAGIAVPLTAVGLYIGWRRWLRPYLCWNAGGLVDVTPLRVVRISWSARSRVEQAEGGGVAVFDDEAETFVAAVPRTKFRLVPAAPGERTGAELANALRYAREQAVRVAGAVSPPAVEPPRPPVGLLLAGWIVLAPLAVIALNWVASD